MLSINDSYAQNLIKNPDFESGTLTPYWDSWPHSIPPSSTIDNINAYEGNYCTRLENDEVYFYQSVSLEPNTSYIISATVKTELGDNVLFGVSNVYSTDGVSLYFTNTNYKTETFSFTTDGSPGNDPNIYFWKEEGTGKAWVDSIVLVKDPQENYPDPPGGFSTYYISNTGNDSNTGTSPAEAWQSINKVNSIGLGSGDKVLFKGGETFNGTIFLDDNDYGTPGNNILIGSYGSGRAIINAQNGSGLIAFDSNNISLKNINFNGNGRLYGNTGNGVTFSYCSNIEIDSVEISGFQHSGLKIRGVGNNINISNIFSHDNGYAGIHISGNSKPALNDIYIGHCIIDNNPGDPTVTNNHSGNGIFAYNVTNILIEYCKASNNGWDMPWGGNGPGGIWVAEVDSAIIQHCISHDNKTPLGASDGLGFDLDGGTTNSIIQYCLSYNNEGAGYGIFQYAGATDWKNNTIRFCISENDGNISASGSVMFWHQDNSNQFQDFEFYNNVVYNTGGPALSFLDHRNSNFNLRNNIFFSASNSVHNDINGENFQGNCWYSTNGEFIIGSPPAIDFNTWATSNNQEIYNGEIVGMFSEPSLINPGYSNITDPSQLDSVDDYKVNEESPVTDAGLELSTLFSIDPGPTDYFGKPIKQGSAFDMGVFEFPIIQKIVFQPGWNIFSVNNMPDSTDMEFIFQSLIDNSSLLKIQDELGNTLEDWGTYGGWINNIGNIDIAEGYKIKLDKLDSIEVQGFQNDYPIGIVLKNGWNIIGYPHTASYDGMNLIFQELINKGTLLKVQDEAGNSIEDWGTYGDWQNSIGDFNPGEGYKVKVNTDDTLWIYESYPKSSSKDIGLVPSTYFKMEIQGNGFNHMNINLIGLKESGIMENDEIGIFDGNLCVGAALITKPFIKSNRISIPVSASDGNGRKVGFTEGNTVSLKIYRNGIETPITIESLNNMDKMFKEGSSLFCKIEKLTGLVGTYEKLEVKCYPVLFKNEVNIQIKSSESTHYSIIIYNLNGQKIRTLYNGLINKNELIKWDGSVGNNYVKVEPGMYIIMVNNEPFKVIYNP